MENQRINRALAMKMPEERITIYKNVALDSLERIRGTCEDHALLTSVGFKQPNVLVLGLDLDLIDIEKFTRNEACIEARISDILHQTKIQPVIDIALAMFRVEIIDGIARYIFRIADEDMYFDQDQFDELIKFLQDLN